MNAKYWFYYDIIANMLSTKKIKSLRNWSNWTIIYKQFSCFYHTVLFCCAKKYYNKSYTLFNHENSKQTSTSTNCIESFIWYWIEGIDELS